MSLLDESRRSTTGNGGGGGGGSSSGMRTSGSSGLGGVGSTMMMMPTIHGIPPPAPLINISMVKCSNCNEPFDSTQQIINAKGETYHPHCFVCAQCFQAFEDGVYYEFENRKYCEYDFQLLFAPLCRGCKNFISGRVIKAMGFSWHPACFRCHACSVTLIDSGFVKIAQRPYCRECNLREKAKHSAVTSCHQCGLPIEDELLRYKGDIYHPYHFHCTLCSAELSSSARETRGELYCPKCLDKLNLPICAACRTPIDQERIVNALGKQWHVEHFACAKCERPFYGSRHFEKRGLAYCETDYNLLFGDLCFVCNRTVSGDVFSFMNKSWCVEHFTCYLCDEQMNQKTKFYDFDSKPVCKHCFEKLSSKVRSSIIKSIDSKGDKETKSLFGKKKDK